MVFTVRCFKCGESAVRLVLGGRAILHARCHACGSNLLAEVFDFEQEVLREQTLRQTLPPERTTAMHQAIEASDEPPRDPPTGEFDEFELAEMA